MDYYQKLLEIISRKNSLSTDFLKITQEMLNIKTDDLYIENIQEKISDRNDIISEVNTLDEEFIEIFNIVKNKSDFEENINKYPEFSKYINDIKSNFKQAYDLDKDINNIMDEEYKKICSEIKSNKDKKNISDKYNDNSIETLTGSNFGIFLDEKK